MMYRYFFGHLSILLILCAYSEAFGRMSFMDFFKENPYESKIEGICRLQNDKQDIQESNIKVVYKFVDNEMNFSSMHPISVQCNLIACMWFNNRKHRVYEKCTNIYDCDNVLKNLPSSINCWWYPKANEISFVPLMWGKN